LDDQLVDQLVDGLARAVAAAAATAPGPSLARSAAMASWSSQPTCSPILPNAPTELTLVRVVAAERRDRKRSLVAGEMRQGCDGEVVRPPRQPSGLVIAP
jgi:hypothetical protein